MQRNRGTRRTPAPPQPEPDVATRLLAWYDQHRRTLPWRYAPGVTADPYRVWLSEIMLQQTVVKAVVPYFETFVTRWPTVSALAAAPLDDVLAAWAGLGYYSRARNLHRAAQTIASDHGGRFPADEAALRALPGVGPYTAAAIAAIGFGLKATPVDGNIERVVARLFALDTPMPALKPELRRRAATLTPDTRAGDFAQAMMDLGAGVCTPKAPSCLLCPLLTTCAGHAQGIAATLPRKAPKAARPIRYGTAFVVTRADGCVLLRKRPDTGLLAGLYDLPSTEWAEMAPTLATVRAARPAAASYVASNTHVVHIFTHFRLELAVETARVTRATVAPPLVWAPLNDLANFALPTVAVKVLAAAGVEVKRQRPRAPTKKR